jgi:hypothetical protein
VTLLDHHKTAFELMEQWKAENSLPQNCTFSWLPSSASMCVRACVHSNRSLWTVGSREMARMGWVEKEEKADDN